ncbi:MAG TPA: Hsp20/alpha crystallin family protein [Azospirillum sp.]|nr:Hsp20/alpha crystallin family protein [Azospirillum sp.]
MSKPDYEVIVRGRTSKGLTPEGKEESPDVAAVGHMMPDADVIEREGAYQISVELPGLAAADVDVALVDDEVTISAVKPDPAAVDCTVVARHLAERRYGIVRRSFRLPEGADRGDVRAHIENGLLTVVLAKAAGGSGVP